MDTRAERTTALILRTLAYGEKDLIVHLLARGRGRIAAFARAARSSRRRFGAALEPFQIAEVLLVEHRGQEMWSLREAQVLEAHAGLRADLHRLAHAGYAAELVHDLTRPAEPADALFDLLEEFLARLERGAATSARLRALQLSALQNAGLAPELSRCARCGADVGRRSAAFDPDAGGVVCSRCAEPAALVLSAGSRAALAQLQTGGLAGAEAPTSADGSGRPADARAFEEAAAQAARPLASFLAHHLGRSLRSADFLAQVGAPR